MSFIKTRLPELRARRGWTQRQLAVLTGMRSDTISALERGEAAGIRFETLVRLCEALGCQPGELLALQDDGHRAPVLGGPDEDELIRRRLADTAPSVDGPSFVEALLKQYGGR
ncbi:MAG: helix-turn-helix transcriptional regulator [Chloroflexi bacterium]|nr:helix-turn-helix transcriptional regulator [Chloroflexota bacterium]